MYSCSNEISASAWPLLQHPLLQTPASLCSPRAAPSYLPFLISAFHWFREAGLLRCCAAGFYHCCETFFDFVTSGVQGGEPLLVENQMLIRGMWRNPVEVDAVREFSDIFAPVWAWYSFAFVRHRDILTLGSLRVKCEPHLADQTHWVSHKLPSTELATLEVRFGLQQI